MTIIIKTEKVMVHRVPGRKITRISGVLPVSKLPLEYLNNSLRCYNGEFPKGELTIENIYGEDFYLNTNVCYIEKYFQECLRLLYKCGKLLHQINKMYPDVSDSWNGKENFTI